MDKETIYQEYNKVLPLYKRAKKNVQEAIEEFLKEKNISLINIESRIKEFDSFYEKISRKEYDNPFEENEDFCGIRIILYFQDDIEKVCKIIEENFTIKESEDKTDKLEDNEFGYRSNHLIIRINDSWCVTPNYKGLENIKIEVQVRTVLMHTWAAIEHKLGYKNNQQLPKDLIRKLYLMSAQLENADLQFQEIKNAAENFQYTKIEESKKTGKFTAEKLNIDTLQALLEFYFPDFQISKNLESSLLDSLIFDKYSIEDVIENAEKIKPFVKEINSKINSHEYTSRANLLSYAFETYDKGFSNVNIGYSRRKIVDYIKGLKQQTN